MRKSAFYHIYCSYKRFFIWFMHRFWLFFGGGCHVIAAFRCFKENKFPHWEKFFFFIQ